MAKKKVVKRGTPKRGTPKTKRRSAPQGLVKRVSGVVVPDASADSLDRVVITDGIQIGAFGLVELKLSAEAEQVLSEPVNPAEVAIKPTGQPYLSHPAYTKWFNRAFGRLGWALVVSGKPALQGKSVVVPYVLHIHGKPVAMAWGEQDYFEGNREQTYGDAVESTVASALRRCAKRIGVGLELWDRDWVESWKAEHAVMVKVLVKRGDEEKVDHWWRRKTSPKFWQEDKLAQRGGTEPRKPAAGTSSAPPPQTPPPVQTPPRASHGAGEALITPEQRRRFGSLVVNSGRDWDEVKQYLKINYLIEETTKIKRKDYDVICAAIEADGPLKGAH